MKRKTLSIIATAIIFAIALIPFANANAWTVSPSGETYYVLAREINSVADNVTNTFTYSVTTDSSNPAEVTGYPTTATVVFNNVKPKANKVTSTGKIDFSSAVFTEIGNYGFKVKETNSSNPDFRLSKDEYTIWIAVRNATDSNGAVTGEHIATLTGVSDKNGNKVPVDPSDDRIYYGDGEERTYIEVTAFAKGNSADPNECFRIDVHFAIQSGADYTVNTNSKCMDGLAYQSFSGFSVENIITVYLKHDEKATIGIDNGFYQIPLGLEYAIVEHGAKDYKTYIDGSETDSKSSDVKMTVGINDPQFETSNKRTVLNVKEITPKTGLDQSILPFIVIAAIGALGALFIVKSKHPAKNIAKN